MRSKRARVIILGSILSLPASGAAQDRSEERISRQVTPLIQHGYHLLNARLGYEFLDTRAQLALWARNLTDELYFNEGTPIQSSFGSVTRYFAAPRTFGLELGYRF